MTAWTCALTLDAARQTIAGSEIALTDAIRRGADLRVYTEFHHNQHIDTASANDELVREVAEFAVTYLVDNRWTAGLMSQRQPVSLPDGFGPRPSMSFFLYNQDGHQAIGRPHLDGEETVATSEEGSGGMHKYHLLESWDEATNAPSCNFIYDFETYKFYVDDTWQEVLHHDAEGQVRSGSIDALAAAFSNGAPVKVGISGLCDGLGSDLAHEVFVETGSNYYYTDQQLFIAGSHPLIRVRPDIPMRYQSESWDFGWLVLRTDGKVIYRRCDPYSLAFDDRELQHPIRWFTR
ncbi:MAG TPA: hypothetical protein EYQ18_17000 [Candidatus Handelsmanbacteria bacterium]|nr:hypothetical protein [Candidatus Handelsmanbacteria bacterium]